jgi:geranylgeranyl pyrophosphate synthase
MATRVETYMVDDIDGSKATQTVQFALDGNEYSIDLSDRNAEKLRGDLEKWIKAGRKTGGRRSSRKVSGEIDTKAVRVWAQSQGIELSKRGRVPASVVEQFRAAGN